MSEEKFSKCGEGKSVSVEFRVFGKKELKEKFREKNQSVLGGNSKWKILLSSCSLFGVFILICKLKLRRKKNENFQSIFRVGVWS